MTIKAISLMYHDVVAAGAWRTSGFASDDADIYKLEAKEFERHLATIAKTVSVQPSLATDLSDGESRKLFITFDDGGRGAFTHAADLLEKLGWRGHFFVATDFIDTPTFLSRQEIRALHARGHVIGSHSASHPVRMAACSDEVLREEWKKSVAALEDILGEKVTVASVPGGHFSRAVALAAVNAGIEVLFNSEPVAESYNIGNCRIFGRYSIVRATAAHEAEAIARGTFSPRIKQYLFWNAKKIAKKIGGEFYLDVRKRILAKR